MGHQNKFEQLDALPELGLGSEITMPDGSKYAITSIISSIYMDDEHQPVLVFECLASLLTFHGGN